MTRNSTAKAGSQREDGWCKSSPSAQGRHRRRRGQEMARRSPTVIGNEVRTSQVRIQVEPRICFVFALSPNKA